VVEPPVLLAPMAGITNLPLRTLCEEQGCGLTVTEFLAAPALAAGNRKALDKLMPSHGGRAWSAQIFGSDPTQMAKAAVHCARAGASAIDLNMGCPARKVLKGSAGAALMKNPVLAARIVRAVIEATGASLPVTVKTRAGWDSATSPGVEFVVRMVEAGACAITLHGRTALQGYSGKASLEAISAVKRAVAVPVVGNGDVVDAPSLARMFEATGCDAVMIGRAVLGNPWVFAEAKAWWSGAPAPPPPTAADRVRMYLRHYELYLEVAPEGRAVLEMRKFASWYLRGLPGAVALRKTIQSLLDPVEIRALLGRILAEVEFPG
jgi:tRNA-dihydrouridine synthase B